MMASETETGERIAEAALKSVAYLSPTVQGLVVGLGIDVAGDRAAYIRVTVQDRAVLHPEAWRDLRRELRKNILLAANREDPDRWSYVSFITESEREEEAIAIKRVRSPNIELPSGLIIECNNGPGELCLSPIGSVINHAKRLFYNLDCQERRALADLVIGAWNEWVNGTRWEREQSFKDADERVATLNTEQDELMQASRNQREVE